MMKRTLDNCSLIKKHGRPNQYEGKCEGLGTSKGDEPCEVCKECKLHINYDDVQ